MLELLHFDDLGKAGDAFHERILDRLAHAPGESEVGLGRQRLVVKEENQVLEPGLADGEQFFFFYFHG